jgi:hypothetical protein
MFYSHLVVIGVTGTLLLAVLSFKMALQVASVDELHLTVAMDTLHAIRFAIVFV